MSAEQAELIAKALSHDNTWRRDEFFSVEPSSSLGKKKRKMIVALLRVRPERPVLDLKDEAKKIQESLYSLRSDDSIKGNPRLIVQSIYPEDLLDTARNELQKAIKERDGSLNPFKADREVFFWDRLVKVLDPEGSRPNHRKNRIIPFPTSNLSDSA